MGGAKADASVAASVVVNERLPAGAEVPPVALRFGPVNFTTDHADIDEAARQVIAKARDHLRQHPGTAVLVHAYTDTQGTDRRNAGLAQQRAQAVADELVRPGGLAPNRIFSAALGPNDLPQMTGAQHDEQRNRSVWLQVVELPAP